MIDHFAKQAVYMNDLDPVEAMDLDIEALIKFNKIKKFTVDNLDAFLEMFNSETRNLYCRRGKYRSLLKVKSDAYDQARKEQRKKIRIQQAQNLPGEVWKKHPTHNITLSNLGRVRNAKGRLVGRGGVVMIEKCGSIKKIERLIMQTFANLKPYQGVGFKDGNELNFKLDNLFLKKGFTKRKSK